MAGKRMIRLDVIDTDAFLEMPLSTQALYFHLNFRADDDGFIGNPKRILRTIGAQEDDLKLLIAKSFVIQFEDGVIVIKHWRMHNTLSAKRYHETKYLEHKDYLLLKKNGAYSLHEGKKIDDSHLIEMSKRQVNKGDSDDRQAKDESKSNERQEKTNSVEVVEEEKGEEINKKRKSKKESPSDLFERLYQEFGFSDSVVSALSEWYAYKTERKDKFVERGMRSQFKEIQGYIDRFGDEYVIAVVNKSMARQWVGLTWDSVKGIPKKPIPKPLKEEPQQEEVLDIRNNYTAYPKETWTEDEIEDAVSKGIITDTEAHDILWG